VSKKKIELIILGSLILYSFYCALIIGPSWDEFYHYKNGDNIFNYIFSFGTREYHSANFKFHFGLYDFLASFFSKNFRKYISTITKIGGTILLLTGIAILTGQLQVLGFFILEYFPALGNLG